MSFFVNANLKLVIDNKGDFEFYKANTNLIVLYLV